MRKYTKMRAFATNLRLLKIVFYITFYIIIVLLFNNCNIESRYIKKANKQIEECMHFYEKRDWENAIKALNYNEIPKYVPFVEKIPIQKCYYDKDNCFRSNLILSKDSIGQIKEEIGLAKSTTIDILNYLLKYDSSSHWDYWFDKLLQNCSTEQFKFLIAAFDYSKYASEKHKNILDHDVLLHGLTEQEIIDEYRQFADLKPFEYDEYKIRKLVSDRKNDIIPPHFRKIRRPFTQESYMQEFHKTNDFWRIYSLNGDKLESSPFLKKINSNEIQEKLINKIQFFDEQNLSNFLYEELIHQINYGVTESILFSFLINNCKEKDKPSRACFKYVFGENSLPKFQNKFYAKKFSEIRYYVDIEYFDVILFKQKYHFIGDASFYQTNAKVKIIDLFTNNLIESFTINGTIPKAPEKISSSYFSNGPNYKAIDNKLCKIFERLN